MVFWSTAAMAQWVLDYEEDFDRFDEQPFSGMDGWVSGYPTDPCSAQLTGGVRSLDDFNTSSCGGLVWGVAGCNSDHLVQTGRTYGDFALEFTMTTSLGNDDGAGVVFRYQSDSEYYVVMWSRDKLPLPTNEPGNDYDTTGTEARVYSIHGGVGRIVATRDDPTYTIGETHLVRVVATGDRFDVFLDADRDGAFTSAGEHSFSFVDTDHPDPGNIGFMVWTNQTTFDDLRVLVPPPPPEHTGLPPSGHSGRPTGDTGGTSTESGDTADPGTATTDPGEAGSIHSWPRLGDPGCGCSSTTGRPWWVLSPMAFLIYRRSVRRRGP